MKRLAPIALCVLAACGEEEILHELAEPQANQVLVALDEAGIRGHKLREDGAEAGWAVSVAAADASRAQRVLAERELPRPKAPGFGELFAAGSVVATPTEDRARYLHALAGELSRSVEAIDGVVEARVHLTLPASDPLRPEVVPAPRGAVLVKCRAASRAAVDGLKTGIQALLAGAVDGLKADTVSVVVTETASPPVPPPPPPAPPRSTPAAAFLAGAAVLLSLAAACVVWALRGRNPVESPSEAES